MGDLSDHKDSDSFTYERTWEQIERMLDLAERKLNYHATKLADGSLSRKKRMTHARNYKALEGVVKTLRWTLGDKDINNPLE